MLPTLSLFDLPVLNADRRTAICYLFDRAGQTTAAFLNAHCVNTAMGDAAYKRVLRKADVILPDGAGMSLAAKLSGGALTENLNGTDLCLPLCQEAAKRGKSLYLLGAAPGVAEDAARNLMLKVPGLRVVGTHDGYFDQQNSEPVIEQINASGADIVMVAMGVPLQDVWIQQNRKALNARLVMGVGALFDFAAGRVRRAPKAVRQMKLEWVWRLGLEPRRMFKRYVIGNPVFIARALTNAARATHPQQVGMPL